MQDIVSRRALLNSLFRGCDGSAHLCSLIVHAQPRQLSRVMVELNGLDGVDVHQHSSAGKIIVTVEAATDAHVVQVMGFIGDIPGVLSTALVYQQSA